MLLTVGMMALALTACGSDEEANKGTKETTTAIETKAYASFIPPEKDRYWLSYFFSI